MLQTYNLGVHLLHTKLLFGGSSQVVHRIHQQKLTAQNCTEFLNIIFLHSQDFGIKLFFAKTYEEKKNRQKCHATMQKRIYT